MPIAMQRFSDDASSVVGANVHDDHDDDLYTYAPPTKVPTENDAVQTEGIIITPGNDEAVHDIEENKTLENNSDSDK
eukprot:UN05212